MNTRKYITCRELIEFIADYIDGTLEESERAKFERHLTNCRSCRAYLETYRQTMQLARTLLDAEEHVDDVPEELVRTILAERRRLGG